jgi:PAS domain-containing protein
MSEELFQALPVAIYTTGANGVVTSYNEAAVRLWSRRPELGEEEYCGSYRLFWPDGTPLPLDQCPMAMTLRQREPIRGMEAICERPDGTRIALIPYPTPVFDASGNLSAPSTWWWIFRSGSAPRRLCANTGTNKPLSIN